MIPHGAEEYICRLVREYSAMLLKLACTRLPCVSDAEDTVQEVFVKLLKNPVSFRDAGHEKAWLIRATLHRASDIRRRAERRSLPLNEVLEAAAPESPTDLLQAVQSLPERYSAVIHLHYYEGYSIKEIGKLLGLPAATVGTRLARGRERLRKILKEESSWIGTITEKK